jgi:ABC-type uncharacterized transport system permease subunit
MFSYEEHLSPHGGYSLSGLGLDITCSGTSFFLSRHYFRKPVHVHYYAVPNINIKTESIKMAAVTLQNRHHSRFAALSVIYILFFCVVYYT